MPKFTFHNNINFYSSSGLNFYPTPEAIVSESGYRLEVFNSGSLVIYKPNSGSIPPQYIINISGSEREPKFGIGFQPNEKFDKNFEIKSQKDEVSGTELTLKSSRLNIGAQDGDKAGTINFTISSASFKDVDISGSIANIEAEVTLVNEEGATGDIVFNVAKSPKLAPTEVVRIGGLITKFSNSITADGSNLTVTNNLISNGNTLTGVITASGDISSSGNVYGANLIGNILVPVDSVPQYNQVSYYHSVASFGDIPETSSIDFKFFRPGESGHTNSTLHLSGSLLITGSTTIIGPLIVTGSQLITDDIISDGTIRARVKSFDIPHPTRKNKRLVYGALEGPEHGIYCRGESKDLQVLLPPEWRAMVNTKEVTVQITPIGEWQPLYFKKLHSNWLYFGCGDERENVHFYWEIKGERTDVPKLQTVQ